MMPVILRMTLENRKPTFCVRFGRRIAKSCMAGGGQLWAHARMRERPRRAPAGRSDDLSLAIATALRLLPEVRSLSVFSPPRASLVWVRIRPSLRHRRRGTARRL